MALKVKAKEREMKVGKNPGEYRYVMLPELYSTLDQDKVINEAAIRSGVNEGVMRACWDGAGKVIKAWATEGHSVALPGLGTMRPTAQIKKESHPLGWDLFLILYLFTLVIFQNLTWHQADVLADMVQTAEGIDSGVALTCNGLQRLTLLDLVEVGLRSE